MCKASDEFTQTFERIVYSVSCFPPPLPWHVLWGKEKHGLMSTPQGVVTWKCPGQWWGGKQGWGEHGRMREGHASPMFLVLPFEKRDAAPGSCELAPSLPPGSRPVPAPPSSLIPLPGCRQSAVFLLDVCRTSGWACANSLALLRPDSIKALHRHLSQGLMRM